MSHAELAMPPCPKCKKPLEYRCEIDLGRVYNDDPCGWVCYDCKLSLAECPKCDLPLTLTGATKLITDEAKDEPVLCEEWQCHHCAPDHRRQPRSFWLPKDFYKPFAEGGKA